MLKYHIRGKCKLINADCFEVLKKMPMNCVDITFTSPPYNRKRNDTYKYYNDTLKDYYGMLISVTDELLRVTKGCVIINLQPNYYCKTDVYRYIGAYSTMIQHIIVWNKKNPTPANSNNITNAYELFIVLSDKAVKTNGGYVKNSIISTINTEKFNGHSAVMKMEVAEWFIKNFTKEGQTILDPFAGCCTTAVACLKHGRKSLNIELVKEYYEMGKNRIESILGTL